MAIAFVQSTKRTVTTGTLTTTAFASATVAGRLIVVFTGDDSGLTTTVTNVTDNKGNTYTKVLGVATPALQCWYSVITGAGTGHTVSVTWSESAAGRMSAIAQEFSGLTGPSPLDVFVSASGSSANASSGATAVPSTSSSLVVVGVNSDENATASITPGPVTQGGKTTVGVSTGLNGNNRINASKFTTNATGGYLSSISVNVGLLSVAPNNQGQVALYSDVAGRAGNLIASSASATLAANAWTTIPISAVLAPNTVYWLALNANGLDILENNLKYDSAASGTTNAANSPFGTWPSTFPAPDISAIQFSMYGSYTQYGNADQIQGVGANLGMCSKVISTATAQTGTMSVAPAGPWRCATVVFKELSASGPSNAVRSGFFLVM